MTRSIQSLPSNSGTTSVTDVYTSTGFNAGDPVIFQDGDYKSPANVTPPSTVNFSYPNEAAINPQGTGGIISPSFSYAQMQTGMSGGTSRRFAAVLTNGNIVQAFSSYDVAPTNPNRVFFRIVDSNHNVVVSPTLVSPTFISANNACVSVTALVGGGFAVGWLNSSGGTSNSANYAIYDNTGSVVTAAVQDTSFAAGATYVPLEMTSLANGGFAIAVKTSAAVIFLRAYSATGVGAYATVDTGITAIGNENSFAITARNDNSVFICDRIASTQYRYTLLDSSGVVIVGPTTFTISGSANGINGSGGPDASVLTNGTTIVVGFTGSNGNVYPCFRFLPTGNVISSEFIGIPPANLHYQTVYAGGYFSVLTLSSNNFIVYFSDGYGNMQYAFYNSSGVCISGSNSIGAIPLQVNGGYCAVNNRVTLLESGDSVYAYWTAATDQQKPVQQVYLRINKSTYSIVPVTSVDAAPFVIPNVPTGAVALSGVTPSGVSYFAAASTTAVATTTPAITSGPVTLSPVTCNAIASCTLPNGNLVFVYKPLTLPYPVYAALYNSSGGKIGEINVGNGTSTFYSVRVAALSGGGFVVGYMSTTTALTMAVYSSSYAFINSLTIPVHNFSANYNFDMTGLQDNKFAVFYSIDGTEHRVRVYNSSFALLTQFQQSNTAQGLCVAGNAYGGFAIQYFAASEGQGRGQTYVPTGENSWALAGNASINQSQYCQSPQLCSTESGQFVATITRSSTVAYGMFTEAGNAQVSYTGTLSSWPLGSSAGDPTTYPMLGIGTTGNGNVVIASSYSGSPANLGIACLPAQMTFSVGQPLPYSLIGNNNVNMFSFNAFSFNNTTRGLNANPRVTSGAGNSCIITYINTSDFPVFIIVNGTNNSIGYSVVAGVTLSSISPIAPTTNSSNITGVMAGIAVTSATAGSTGQVAVSGQVLLGSSYTSTATGAFDQTGGAVSGVKGTFNGRSVNLQGNS